MNRNRKIQLLLVLAGVFVLIAIYLAPREVNEKDSFKETIAELEGNDHNHEHEVQSEKEEYFSEENISKSLKSEFNELEKKAFQVEVIDTKLAYYDSLISLSIKNNLPPRVAKYSVIKAELVSTEVNWMLAGDNYFKAFRLSKNTSKSMIEGAIECYDKVLELNPENLDAQTAIGVAYVEGSSALGQMPMKGIGILKEVLNKDPKNINALTNLGYFAIQSGQYEKAIERFNTVLEIDPDNAEAYIYLADVYLSQDNIDQGIATLEKYKSLVDDPIARKQVDDYIKELRNK